MRLTLKTVLIGSIGLLALAAVGQGAASISKITSVEQSSSAVTKNWLPSVSIINEINTSTRDVRVKLYRFVVASNTVEGFSKNEAALIEANHNLEALKRRYEPLISSAEEKALYDAFSSTLT